MMLRTERGEPHNTLHLHLSGLPLLARWTLPTGLQESLSIQPLTQLAKKVTRSCSRKIGPVPRTPTWKESAKRSSQLEICSECDNKVSISKFYNYKYNYILVNAYINVYLLYFRREKLSTTSYLLRPAKCFILARQNTV